MRAPLIALALLAIAGTALPHPPASGPNLLRLHPAAWRFPAAVTSRALRSDPDESAVGPALRAFAVPQAAARARAEANVVLAPDGSRHVVVGAALRSWSVASIDAQGRLVTDCVHGAEAAAQHVEPAAAPTPEVKR